LAAVVEAALGALKELMDLTPYFLALRQQAVVAAAGLALQI
jgi:hypothetical protein